MFKRRKRSQRDEAAEAQRPVEVDEDVNILRYLRDECIELELGFSPSAVPEEETEAQRDRRLIKDKEAVVQELADVLDNSGDIQNPTRFYKDLLNRERKASTGIAPGIAVPHVRSMQVKNFLMGFARSREGVHFASLDGTPTRLFFLLASPAGSDASDKQFERLYLRVYRQLAEMLQNEWTLDSFMDAESKQDVINILRGYIDQ